MSSITSTIFTFYRTQWRRFVRPQVSQRQWRDFVKNTLLKSPYYRDQILTGELNPDTVTVEDFPVLTKQCYLENFDRISTDPNLTLNKVNTFLKNSSSPTELLNDEYVVMHTSGTSGGVTPVVYSKVDFDRAMLRLGSIIMLAPREEIALISNISGHYTSAVMQEVTTQSNHWYGVKCHSIDAGLPLQEIIDRVSADRPSVLFGHAEVLRRVSAKLNYEPRMIVPSGETLTASMVNEFMTLRSTKTVDLYASAEHLMMGWRTLPDKGLKLCTWDLIFEFEENRTLVTNLSNHTMPLVRYQLDDVLTPMGEGRWRIQGRCDKSLEIVNIHGELQSLHGLLFSGFSVPNLQQYQIEQFGSTSLLFRLCVSDQALITETIDETKKHLKRILDKRELSLEQWCFEVVDSIPINPKTKKFDLIVERSRSAAKV